MLISPADLVAGIDIVQEIECLGPVARPGIQEGKHLGARQHETIVDVSNAICADQEAVCPDEEVLLPVSLVIGREDRHVRDINGIPATIGESQIVHSHRAACFVRDGPNDDVVEGVIDRGPVVLRVGTNPEEISKDCMGESERGIVHGIYNRPVREIRDREIIDCPIAPYQVLRIIGFCVSQVVDLADGVHHLNLAARSRAGCTFPVVTEPRLHAKEYLGRRDAVVHAVRTAGEHVLIRTVGFIHPIHILTYRTGVVPAGLELLFDVIIDIVIQVLQAILPIFIGEGGYSRVCIVHCKPEADIPAGEQGFGDTEITVAVQIIPLLTGDICSIRRHAGKCQASNDNDNHEN